MDSLSKRSRFLRWCLFVAPVLAAGAGLCPVTAAAQTSADLPCTFNQPRPRFPRIPIWAYAGAYQDSSLISPRRCVGSFQGPLPDSVVLRPRTVTVRFLRDRIAEADPNFGGYRIYRVTVTPDTSRMVLIRRFSRQVGDERTWNFSVVDTSSGDSLPLRCNGNVVNDSVVTFVDPDSIGRYVKVCRRRVPPNDPMGACASPGDSVLILIPPPGPHDGFSTWYSITYEQRNTSLDAGYEDMFVPDTTGVIAPCGDPNDPATCPNLNNKCYNMTAVEVEPTGGPTPNLQRVGVVPNPYRAREAWDQPGAHEVHFINLPQKALIKVYTVSGDLIVELQHNDKIRDFERWDLKNQDGRDIASGIYMYRIEADQFQFQDRFIVIR